jgi:ABC-type glycerol-3-phosphate transport system permease component
MATTAQISTTLQESKSRPKRFPVTGLLLTVLFLILAFLFTIPIYWMIISSLRPQELIFTSGTNLIPSVTTLDNYDRLFTTVPYARWFLNSVVQSISYSVFTVAICTLGGFALAKYQFRFRSVIFVAILFTQMIPFHLLIVSLFLLVINLKMVDSLVGAILPLAAHPVGIFFMRQYMLAIEDDLLDAARVDGANEYQLFFRMVLPNIQPAIATLLVLFALEYWNNLLWPLIVFRSPDRMPLAVGLSTLVNQYFSAFDLVMAGSTLATIPIIILFLFLRKQFMEGFAAIGTGGK